MNDYGLPETEYCYKWQIVQDREDEQWDVSVMTMEEQEWKGVIWFPTWVLAWRWVQGMIEQDRGKELWTRKP